MTVSAAGNRYLIGLAREQKFGQMDPAAELEYLRPILPADVGLEHPEAASGEVNQSGYIEKGVPGPVAGPINLAARFSAVTVLAYLEHLFGSCTKTTLATGIYQYLFEPVRADLGVDTSFAGIYGLPPVEQGQLLGVKFSQMAMVIGNNTAIPCRLTGQIAHGTSIGVAVPAVANMGTYTMGPLIRGVPKTRTGSIFIKVTRVSTGLQVKLEQSSGVPTFPGAAIDVVLDPDTLAGDWQNATGGDGLDLGYNGENRDPVEFCFPGTAADHADLAVGDIFELPLSWDLPDEITYLGGQRFTSAHWINEYRALGGTTWIPYRALTGTLTLARPASIDQGSGSKYPYGLDRDGLLTPTLQFARKYNSSTFQRMAEEHKRFELRTSFVGAQLSATYRESIVATWSNVGIASRTAAPQNQNAINETVTLRGETSDDGDLPISIAVITDRSFTPAT